MIETAGDAWLRSVLSVKREGGTLDPATWERIVRDYVAGRIDDAPMAALAMACAIRGMSEDEIVALTSAKVDSGDRLTFPGDRVVVDKHSSGGVGDTVSLIAVPTVAACGVPVAKLSGRALAHTGGTLDKLEAIQGVRTDLDPAVFVAQVQRIGCAIAAQSERLVPADKRLYALRDRTATVPSVGLIAASIVSKKIAGGAHAIVFDVKAGRGAFMQAEEEARELAGLLVSLARRFGRRASAIVSAMDEPLGDAIGTGLEVIEARDFLARRKRSARLEEATLAVVHEMLGVAGVPHAHAPALAARALESGSAYERFVTMIEAQGGSRGALERLAPHPRRIPVIAPRDGLVAAVDSVALGELARELTQRDGAAAGIRLVVRGGTAVQRGELLAEVFGTAVEPERVAAAFTLRDAVSTPRPVVAAVIRHPAEARP